MRMLLAPAQPRSMIRLPALLALLLLADAAGAQTPQGDRTGSAAAGDSLQKVVSKEYEVYGSAMEDVLQANGEIKAALNQWVGYIGVRPKKMAFVLFRTEAEAARFDPKPFAKRRMPVVLWVLPAGPPSGATARVDANPYTLGHHVGHQFLIAFVAGVLAEMGKAGAGGAGAEAGTNGIMVPVPRHPDTAALPDWIEEAVATHCEGALLQRSRLEFMRSHLEQRIPFAEFLEMRRPGAGGPDPRKSQTVGGSSGGSKGGAASAGGSAAAGAEREAIFCAESMSLARFIGQREQERFVGMIVGGVLHGRTVGDVLNTTQDILSKPQALEKQWLEWMQGGERTP